MFSINCDRLFFSDETPRPLGRLMLAGMQHRSGGLNPRSLRVYGRYALVILCGGAGFYRDANGFKTEVVTGDAMLIFPELPHAYGPRPSKARGGVWNEIYLCFDGPIFDLWRREQLLGDSQPVRKLENWSQNAQTLSDLAQKPRPTTASEHWEQLQSVLAILASWSELQNPNFSSEPAWLSRAKAVLESNLDQNVSGETVARAAGLSYESFRKQWAQKTGISPAKYRAQKRLEAAKILLEAGQMTQGAIARSLGLRDEAHLSRRFRDFYGQSPRQWKAKK